MKGPLISVVMSIYNEPEKWLRESIESILNQTYNNFEFIIINDNPINELNGIILNEYCRKDNRIVIIENEENIGLTKSLNKGFSIAKGEYIVRMDSDDISINNRFEIQHEFMEKNKDIGVCGSWINFFGDVHFFSTKKMKMPTSSENIKIAFPFYNPLIHPSVMFRKSSIADLIPLYEPECRSAQDYLLWEKLINNNVLLANLKRVLLLYRISNIQISKTRKHNQYEVANTIQLRYLDKIGVILSENEQGLYQQIVNKEDLLSPNVFYKAEYLLIRIRECLVKKEDIDIDFLNKILFFQWLYCFLNLNKNKTQLYIFIKSSLFKFKYLRIKDLVKIICNLN